AAAGQALALVFPASGVSPAAAATPFTHTDKIFIFTFSTVVLGRVISKLSFKGAHGQTGNNLFGHESEDYKQREYGNSCAHHNGAVMGLGCSLEGTQGYRKGVSGAFFQNH